MKALISILIITITSQSTIAQYYYHDIIAIKQVTEKWRTYKDNKVKSVNILSFENNSQPTEGFVCQQNVKGEYSEISTYTKTGFTKETYSISYYYTNGLLKKNVDTSKGYESSTEYIFETSGNVSSVSNSSVETISNIKNTEQHFWKYGTDGKPVSMIKIKNGNDTTFIRFVNDEKGNIAEEHATRNKFELPVIYYYYDDNKRLTDIVRYNAKAKRLLPDYIFTYGNGNQLSSMLFVPEGSNDYNKWIYEYDEKGLRTKESCFTKQKELLGKIEYQYGFAK